MLHPDIKINCKTDEWIWLTGDKEVSRNTDKIQMLKDAVKNVEKNGIEYNYFKAHLSYETAKSNEERIIKSIEKKLTREEFNFIKNFY